MAANWLLDNLFVLISAIFGSGSLVALFLEKNKRKIEEKQLNADALSKMQEAYNVFTKDAMERYEDLRREVGHINERLNNVKIDLKFEQDRNKELYDNAIILSKEKAFLEKELKECSDKYES